MPHIKDIFQFDIDVSIDLSVLCFNPLLTPKPLRPMRVLTLSIFLPNNHSYQSLGILLVRCSKPVICLSLERCPVQIHGRP